MVSLAAMIGCIIGVVLLRLVGRRKMMMISQLVAFLLSILFIIAHRNDSSGLQLSAVIVFTFASSFGMWTMGMCYIVETTSQRATGVAFGVGWLLASGVALVSPILIKTDYI